jgi:glucokinase
LAVTALARAGHFLGQTLADFLHIFNPTALIIGGGVSLTGPLLMDPLKTSLKVNVITQKYLEHLTVTNAALGDEAGLVGALALAHSLSGK